MASILALVLALAAAVSPPPPSAGPATSSGTAFGTVSGRVSLMKNGAALTDASNCVVWIEGAHRPVGLVATTKPAHPEMKSQGKRFVPRVVAVEKNSEVEFPNVDPIYHNVFSVSPSNRFDLGLYRSGGSKAKKFEEPGVVRVYCNIHPQMVGFVLVVDSDFSAVTGPDGVFRFDNVPVGTWQVKAWQEEGGEGQATAAVHARADAPVALRLDASEFKSQPHKNKYGKDYPPNAGNDDERY